LARVSVPALGGDEALANGQAEAESAVVSDGDLDAADLEHDIDARIAAVANGILDQVGERALDLQGMADGDCVTGARDGDVVALVDEIIADAVDRGADVEHAHGFIDGRAARMARL
jgi:hypothetical protein